jgi:hypothetical protein
MKMIEQLGNRQFQIREQAQRELEGYIGAHNLLINALKQGKIKDEEIRRRLQLIINEQERRLKVELRDELFKRNQALLKRMNDWIATHPNDFPPGLQGLIP